MTIEIRARYANGVLVPLEPLDLEEGCEATLSIDAAPQPQDEQPRSLAEEAGAYVVGPAASAPEAEEERGPLAWMLDMIDEMERTMPPDARADVPTDGSKNYKHYLYGHPKRDD